MSNQIHKILTILRVHWFIVINALIMSILVMSPVIVFPMLSGSNYRGFNIGHSSEDEFFYIARGKEVLEGHGLGNPYFREGKDGPEMFHSVIEQILVRPLKWLGVTSGQTLVTYYYFNIGFGIFLLILLIYVLVWQLTKNKLLAATTALFVVGGVHFIISNASKTVFSSFSFDLNQYQRPTFPVWSSVPFFIFLNLLVKSIKSSNWKYTILSGIVFGTLFYIYFFCWSFAFTLLGCLFLIALARRDYHEMKKITAITLLGIAIGLYNLIDMYQFEQSAVGQQTLFISHQIKSYNHAYKISGLSAALTALFGIFVYKRRNDRNWPFFLSVILAGFIVLNTQIITGRELLDFHYSRYFIQPLAIIIGLYMVVSLLSNVRFQRILLIVLLICMYIDTVAREYRGTRATFEIKNYAQQYRPIIDYLNVHEPSVVLGSDMFYSDLVIVYTQSDLLWSEMEYMYVFPMSRLEDIINIYYYINREGRKNFTDFIYNLRQKSTIYQHVRYHPIYELSSYTIKNEGEGELNADQIGNLYNLYKYIEGYQLMFQSSKYTDKLTLGQLENIITPSDRQQVIASLAHHFEEVSRNPANIVDILKKYQVRYIMWDTVRQPEWDLSTLPGLKEVLVSGNIHLYRLSY